MGAPPCGRPRVKRAVPNIRGPEPIEGLPYKITTINPAGQVDKTRVKLQCTLILAVPAWFGLLLSRRII